MQTHRFSLHSTVNQVVVHRTRLGSTVSKLRSLPCFPPTGGKCHWPVHDYFYPIFSSIGFPNRRISPTWVGHGMANDGRAKWVGATEARVAAAGWGMQKALPRFLPLVLTFLGERGEGGGLSARVHVCLARGGWTWAWGDGASWKREGGMTLRRGRGIGSSVIWCR